MRRGGAQRTAVPDGTDAARWSPVADVVDIVRRIRGGWGRTTIDPVGVAETKDPDGIRESGDSRAPLPFSALGDRRNTAASLVFCGGCGAAMLLLRSPLGSPGAIPLRHAPGRPLTTPFGSPLGRPLGYPLLAYPNPVKPVLAEELRTDELRTSGGIRMFVGERRGSGRGVEPRPVVDGVMPQTQCAPCPAGDDDATLLP